MKIVDKNINFVEFRKKYPVFTYESFDYKLDKNGISFEFHFHIDNKFHFRPSSYIDYQQVEFFDKNHKPDLENIIFHIGMIELISYWKATCSPIVVIKPFQLNDEQILWWKKLWYNGLGEFFYVNSISVSIDDFMQVSSGTNPLNTVKFNPHNTDAAIVPVGGGKDSPVTLELIKNSGHTVIPFIINPRGATLDTVKMSGIAIDKFISAGRNIDPLLLELNSQGFLNGHTPFSAMLAFYTVLVAQMIGVADIALSNESSANESTVQGTDVNHQYSKSFEFENDFRNYCRQYVADGFNYFSFLRPLNELQIARLFSRMTSYHQVFRSCNVGSKENIWCGQCPKCLFAYIILSPFLVPEKLDLIFGSNLYENKSLLPVFDELIGNTLAKPFECVGTVSEVNEAVQLALKNHYDKQQQLPYLLEYYKSCNKQSEPGSLGNWNKNHNLLPQYEKLLQNVL